MLDILALNSLLQDLFRHESETDSIGNHFPINIVATTSVYAARKLVPGLFDGYAWAMLVFFAPLLFHNAIPQLWIQRQISMLAKLDRDLRKLSLMLVEGSVLIFAYILYSPQMGSLQSGICWLYSQAYTRMALNTPRKVLFVMLIAVVVWWYYCFVQSTMAAYTL